MRIGKLRSNAAQRKLNPSKLPVKDEGCLDTWLQRLSHIAQVGLFIFSVGTIYYTVIPLYQKSLLDEAIAQKEVELKEANKALRATYEKARPFIARDFALRLSFECSPFGQQANERRNSKTERSESKRFFDYEVLSCIQQLVATENGIGQLFPADKEALKSLALRVGESIERLKQEELEKLNSVGARAIKDPESLPPPGQFMQQYLDFASRFESPQKLEKVRLESRIKEEKSRIALEYQSEAQKAILRVQEIQWPK